VQYDQWTTLVCQTIDYMMHLCTFLHACFSAVPPPPRLTVCPCIRQERMVAATLAPRTTSIVWPAWLAIQLFHLSPSFTLLQIICSVVSPTVLHIQLTCGGLANMGRLYRGHVFAVYYILVNLDDQ
jgi:hypothetical protein